MALRVYYAHPISIYNTTQEERQVAALRALGFDVFNPNAPCHNEGYQAEGMAYFERHVTNCDALAFSAFPDGSIPAGVVKEIEAAKSAGLPVIELPVGVKRRALDVDETREYLREAGAR